MKSYKMENNIDAWDKAKEVYKCGHIEREYRYKILSNGARSIYHQCVLCGNKGTMVKKASVPEDVLEQLCEVDEEIIKAHYDKISNYATSLNETLKSLEKQDTQDQYYRYLESPEWKEKRIKVLERDRYVCQACLESRSNTVHHLTYAHIYREPLFDLVSVCKECHENIHQQLKL